MNGVGNAGQIGIYVSVAVLVLASQALAIEFKTSERCQQVWERYSQCTRNVGSSACENELWQSCEKIPEPAPSVGIREHGPGGILIIRPMPGPDGR